MRDNVLTDTTFIFEKGKMYGLVAINGSGKTSLFRAITNLISLNEGSITLDPYLSIFYYETTEWFDTCLSGRDYLEFVKKLWNSSASIEDEIAFWSMETYINSPIKKYSLGMKQRLLIAMYFVSEADCFFMDEITNGLDEDNRKRLLNRLASIDKTDKIIVLTSHYKEEIFEVCDCIVEIKNQKLIEVTL